MRHVIAGTAGHIDHGKTTLVRALTGIDTDRLGEEKRRGISIDLGFAHLDISDDVRIAIVDVPGHEKFVKNMLAGVGGIDMVLLVVAADESIKPQTREHLDICRLLRIPVGVIAVTKRDSVDPEILDLVQLEIQDFVAGSFLEGAPIIPVSGVSGEGIIELKQALASTARAVRVKDVRRLFRLPVDRAFSMTGFGTVVTGTILSGTVSVEDEVQAYPGTATYRLRSVQVHGEPRREAQAGQRAALNLVGDRPEQLERGVVLASPGLFEPACLVDCSVDVLASSDPIKHGAPVHFHAGTAEITGEIRILDSTPTLAPGRTHIVRLVLSKPLLLLPGDRFILRRFSPVVTIGGGHIIDVNPPRSNRAAALSRARVLDAASLGERIRIIVEESESAVPLGALVSRLGESESELIANLPGAISVFGEPPTWLLGVRRLQTALDALRSRLTEFHRHNPLTPGLSKEELRSQYFPGAPPFVFDAILKQADGIGISGELVQLKTHQVAFKADEEEALARIESAFAQAGLAVPSLDEVLKQSGVEAVRAKSLLQILLRGKRLVRVGDNLVYHSAVLDDLRSTLKEKRGQVFSVAEFKEWTGVSRKYAIPLLEFLDRERLTRRSGDSRTVV